MGFCNLVRYLGRLDCTIYPNGSLDGAFTHWITMKIDLENLVMEFLSTLDDHEDVEYYMTEKEHAYKWINKFMKWMRKKYSSWIGFDDEGKAIE
jgi:hypothetical protein